MGNRFPTDLLDRLHALDEVETETRSATREVHRTIIWIVVVGGEPYVRSVRGVAGRWYKEALADPAAAGLVVDGTRYTIRFEAASNEADIKAVNDALRAKYGQRARQSTQAMLVPRTFQTTMRLAPAG